MHKSTIVLSGAIGALLLAFLVSAVSSSSSVTSDESSYGEGDDLTSASTHTTMLPRARRGASSVFRDGVTDALR